MDKDIKKISLTSPAWEYKKVIDICNEQSKNGFHLEKVKVLGKSIFKKDESKRYVYDVDFNSVILKKNKEREKYLEMFSEQGWEFVDSTFNGFSIFRKEYQEGLSDEDYKIYTDRESANELYSRLERLLKTVLMIFIPIELFLVITGSILLYISGDLSLIQLLIMVIIILAVCCLPLTLFLTYGMKTVRKLRD